jgi:hypothetical protein
MEQVVPLFKSFITIFYFKTFELRKSLLDWIKFEIILNKFERVWIDWLGWFKTRHCGRGTHMSVSLPPPLSHAQHSRAAHAHHGWLLVAGRGPPLPRAPPGPPLPTPPTTLPPPDQPPPFFSTRLRLYKPSIITMFFPFAPLLFTGSPLLQSTPTTPLGTRRLRLAT